MTDPFLTKQTSGIWLSGQSIRLSDFFNNLLDLISDPVWAISVDGKHMLYLNRAAETIYGNSKALLEEREFLWMSVIHPDDKPTIVRRLGQINRSLIVESEFRILKDDGTECWLQAKFCKIEGSDGVPDHIGVLAKDITQRVNAEQQLDESRAIYESLVQSIPIRVFRKNRNGKLVFCNQTYCKSLGKPLEELIGKTDDDLFDTELAKKYKEDDKYVIQSGQPIHKIEEHPGNSDRGVTYVEVIKVPVKDVRGRRIGIQGIFWDVTERVVSQKSLEQAKDIAESASRAKSDFLANVSHEIRTPMNAVLGMTELLLDTISDRQHREYLHMIHQSGETLLDLINDLLDFSKIEAGKLELEYRPFDLVESVADSVRALAVRAQAKNLELVADFALPWSLIVMSDGTRLRQVISNLVGNAIKFTHHGEVVIRLKLLENPTARTAKVLFEVIDSGIGIPEDKIELVFQKFEQADKSTTREYGGTGLGLAISSKIVEMLGGKLQVESHVGSGSRFHFSLDFTLPDSGDDKVASPDFARRKILIVEDHSLTRKSLQSLVQSWNFECIPADSLAACKRKLIHGSKLPRQVDAALVDLSLPNESSAGLIRFLRSHQPFAALPVIVMASGQRISAEIRELGVDQVLKPVKPSDLLERFAKLFALPGLPKKKTTRFQAPKAKKNLNILLAEDNVINQRLARAILESFGHLVSAAEDGEKAIELFKAENFDLVLMDVQMPKIDGLTAVKQIRQSERPGEHVPIIALSAHTYQGFREQCLSAGMDEYMPKPLRRNVLVDAIERLTGHQSSVRKAVEKSKARIVDWRQAFETVGGDRRLLRQIVDVFLEEHPKMLVDIERAVKNQDAQQLKIAAHSLKGALNYLGARTSVELVGKIENTPPVDGFSEVAKIFVELTSSIKELTLELGKFKTKHIT